MLHDLPRDRDPTLTLSRAASSRRFLEEEGASPQGETVLLSYGPLARGNMFQDLLYREAWRFGFAPAPVTDILAMGDAPWRGPMVCHFHWLASATEKAGRAATDSDIQLFGDYLARLRDEGRKIAWTVHNVLPHDARDMPQAVRVRQMMAEAADAIHVMNKETPALCAPYFALDPDKVFHTAHPSYVGAYPDYVSRLHARFQLGLPAEGKVFLAFGAIQAYKGLTHLLEAYRKVATLHTRLVIAGKPQDDEGVKRMREAMALHGDVIVVASRIAAEDVQLFFRAADWAVCPYLKTLNSGAAMLALTFGVPVIAPAVGCFTEAVADERGILYSQERPSGLADALGQALGTIDDALSARCRDYAYAHRPEVTSQHFMRELGTMTKIGNV